MSHPYLPAVIALVQRAGQATLPHWRNDVAVIEKADASPVTAADLADHDILAAGLRELAPDVPVLSEEDAGIPFDERAGWQRLRARVRAEVLRAQRGFRTPPIRCTTPFAAPRSAVVTGTPFTTRPGPVPSTLTLVPARVV